MRPDSACFSLVRYERNDHSVPAAYTSALIQGGLHRMRTKAERLAATVHA